MATSWSTGRARACLRATMGQNFRRRTSQHMTFGAYKGIVASQDPSCPSAASVRVEPVPVCRASGACGKKRPAWKRFRGQTPERASWIGGRWGGETRDNRGGGRSGGDARPSPAHPAYPRRDCRRGGARVGSRAAVLRLHARRPDGTPTQDRDVYAEIIARIRACCEAILPAASRRGMIAGAPALVRKGLVEGHLHFDFVPPWEGRARARRL